MDPKRKKELMEEYQNRRPEMGVISLRCKASGDSFLGISKDTATAYNGLRSRLNSSWHPNKRLQELWEKYGEEGFEFGVVKVLKYENPADDHTEELEKLRDECLAADSQAIKLWK